MTSTAIAELFQIQSRYLRSAHLERDFEDPKALTGYVLTPEGRELLSRLAAGLTAKSGRRAWRITGDGLLHELVSVTAAERRAVVLVGRDEQKLVDRLVLDSELISELRVRMQRVDANTLAAGKRQQWTNAVASREIFIQLEQGLVYSRDGWKRSFRGTDYDILLIVGPYVEEGRSPISAQRTVQDQALGPLVIELSMEPA